MSSERSGSNFLTKILDAHPQVCGPSPSHVFRTFAQNILNYSDLDRDENWHCLLEDFIQYREVSLGIWNSHVERQELEEQVGQRRLSALLRYAYEKEAQSHGKQRVFVKENKLYEYLPYLLLEFPGAKFVYLVRDPRDTALSFKKSPNHGGRIIKAVETWKEQQQHYYRIQGYLRDSGRVMRIRYEDLVQEPETCLKALCAFLELEYSPKMLDFHSVPLTVANAAKLANWQNLAKPILQDNFGKFRDELSDLELAFIEKSCANEMRNLGYVPENQSPKILSMLAEELQSQEQALPVLELEALGPEEQSLRQKRQAVIANILERSL